MPVKITAEEYREVKAEFTELYKEEPELLIRVYEDVTGRVHGPQTLGPTQAKVVKAQYPMVCTQGHTVVTGKSVIKVGNNYVCGECGSPMRRV